MRLTDQDLDGFQEAYRQELGKEIDRDDAADMGKNLLRFHFLLMRPFPEEKEFGWPLNLAEMEERDRSVLDSDARFLRLQEKTDRVLGIGRANAAQGCQLIELGRSIPPTPHLLMHS